MEVALWFTIGFFWGYMLRPFLEVCKDAAIAVWNNAKERKHD